MPMPTSLLNKKRLLGPLCFLLVLTGLTASLRISYLLPARSYAGLGTTTLPAVEEETPDCGPAVLEGKPADQRVRHLHLLGVDRWQAAGCRGQGIKIALLDSGFKGYRDHLGKSLPAQVQARSFRKDGQMEARESQHGILCGEVLHALAPDAQLLLATWDTNKPEQFLEAVRWAREQGARIISCSIIMPSWSDGEGGGPIHEQLRKLLGSGAQPGDILCFASAGNTAHRHWCGAFHNDGNGWHAWRGGRTANPVTPWGTERVSVELCWKPGSTYSVHIFDRTTGKEVGMAATPRLTRASCSAVRFLPVAGHSYEARVKLRSGKGGDFHMVALGGELEFSKTRGSIPFPGDGAEVLAVGAVDRHGKRAGYSSCGPNSATPKPDLVAPVPFPSQWRPRPFSGTSAAAPQAAGLAALCWSKHPDWTAEQVRRAMRDWARDLGPAGHDCETGYGMAILPPPPDKSIQTLDARR